MRLFKKYGHEAVRVRDVLGSAADDEIFEYADKNKFIVVTRDVGFADIFIKRKGYGLLLIRLPYYFTADKISRAIEEFLKQTNANVLVNSITVIELGRFRIKKL